MSDTLCENFEICRLVCAKDYKIARGAKAVYIKHFCSAGKEAWSKCNRFTTKMALDFCPDFVLPDTSFSMDEVLTKFDEGSN